MKKFYLFETLKLIATELNEKELSKNHWKNYW